MLEDSDIFLNKVELIMESPTERSKYKELKTIEEKLNFLRNHFVMNEMAIRLLERKYLIEVGERNRLMQEIDELIYKQDI